MTTPPSLEVGVAVLAAQLTEVIKDVSAVQVQLEAHREEHRQAERDRASGRRWLIATAIGIVTAVEIPLGYLIAHLHR